MKGPWFRVVLIALPAVLLAWLAAAFFPARDTFYDASRGEPAGSPGNLIRAEVIPAFDGAKAWRVLYRSTGLKGEPIAVSGVVVAPDMAPSTAGHPVVAWAHPTTGVARKCAPSLGSDVLSTIPGLEDMIKRGFVVAATDYVGLGTVGPHPYLVGLSAGRSVIDSVRAARGLTQATEQFAVWGHSQGGHAVLWAGKLAADYAPDLKLVGTAAAAPASELAALFEDDLTTPAGQAFTALALLSWSRVYDIPLDAIIDAHALRYVTWIGDECMTNAFDLLIDKIAIHGIKRQFLKADPVKTQPWQDLIVSNTPDALPPRVPLLITQGRNDPVVLPAVTRDYAMRFCRDGGAAQILEMDSGHLEIAKVSAKSAVAWIADRFAGRPAPNDCKELIRADQSSRGLAR